MPSQMMWNVIESLYRGQATDGTVVTVDEPAMMAAQKQAGKGVYDTDWWRETLPVTLDRWGLAAKRWVDDATGMPRAHYTLSQPEGSSASDAGRRTSGSLRDRLSMGKQGE
jgi:hypothetical protein